MAHRDRLSVLEAGSAAKTHRTQEFLRSPNAVNHRNYTAVASRDLDAFNETYPEKWLTWLIDHTVQVPYQLYQIETLLPAGQQQPPPPIENSSGEAIKGRGGRLLRQVWLPRQIKTDEADWVLVALQDLDWRIEPTDICDRMYRRPDMDSVAEDERVQRSVSQKIWDCRASLHKLTIHANRSVRPNLPARSELEVIDMYPAVNIKYNFIGNDVGNGLFTPFPDGPLYRYPNPSGQISDRMMDIVRELEAARGWAHHGGYQHWQDLPIYPGNHTPGRICKERDAGFIDVVEEDATTDGSGRR
ncbi:hypothetical protein EJ05DRAFT_502414 [Pseudovirgaria hyperparasitica]|uniref:Uncharacterized protein n=1 Tax=Pseudovirgaria hyperparasitica TaxID=470096 RepID=A0A6A6W074_9PEZI|nr:uncharacterized protein EJ05DRAFT_502414 [Pseudovirgaria hyperparasitica]KAF2755943.1 hypothetical protein EJ05DRAFT_502414 [Pseudovirgaria hyperparasitica]